MTKKLKGFKYSKKLLHTLYHMRAFQPGDQVVLSGSDKETDIAALYLGAVMWVHSMDDDLQWPVNLCQLDNKGGIGRDGHWDECAKLEDIVAWRSRAHNT